MDARSRIPVLAAALVLAHPGTGQFQTLSGRVFTDKTVGLRISIPNDWVSLPIHVYDRRTVGWFQSAERYYGDPKKGDSRKGRHAVMKILRIEKQKEGEKRRRDYEHRLTKVLKPDSYKATTGTAVGNDDVPVVTWDVRIAGEDIDRQRIVTWVFPGKDVDYAVEFQLLEEQHDDLHPVVLRSLKSFRFVPATETAPELFVEKPFVLRDWMKLPLLERHRRRKAIGEGHEANVLSRLPKGWTVHKSKHFLVLSHTDVKTTKYVHDLVSAFRDWLDDRFGALSDEYPIRTIVRICGDAAEYYAYRSGVWRVDYNFANREIVMANDRGTLKMKDVLWAVFRRYMLDESPEVYFNLPTWFSQALYGMMTRARLKGRKLVFPSSFEELRIFDELRRTGRARIWTAAELMKHPDFGYVPDANPMDNDLILKSRVLFRYIEGPGARCKALRGRDFIRFYVAEIQKLVRELDEEDEEILVWDSDETILAMYDARRRSAQTEEAKQKWPKTPPGFTSRWSTYLRKIRARRVEFANKLFDRTCNWSEGEWAQFQKGFERFYKSKSR